MIVNTFRTRSSFASIFKVPVKVFRTLMSAMKSFFTGIFCDHNANLKRFTVYRDKEELWAGRHVRIVVTLVRRKLLL